MKFDKFPYSNRPKLEVFIMDWFVPVCVIIGFTAIVLSWTNVFASDFVKIQTLQAVYPDHNFWTDKYHYGNIQYVKKSSITRLIEEEYTVCKLKDKNHIDYKELVDCHKVKGCFIGSASLSTNFDTVESCKELAR